MDVDRRTFLLSAGAAVAAACGKNDCDPAAKPGASNACLAPGIPDGAYFDQLKGDLNDATLGTPQIFVDLDRLDANADAIVAGAGADRYRIVEKSLPSLDLLDYVNLRTGANRFLVMHLPFLPAILERFPAAQVLVGKTHPTAAVRRFFLDLSVGTAEREAAAARVKFLVDSRTRLDELIALAKDLSLQLQVGVEIDIGLHRGAVRRPSGLGDVLSGFGPEAQAVTFIGLLGYDGHVAGAPAGPGLDEPTARKAFETAQDTYQEFVDVLKNDFPELVRDDVLFSGGGTSTFPLYTSGPINDVAAGGGMLRPAAYSSLFTGALAPAVFIAAPVLAHADKAELPYVTNLSEGISEGGQGVIVYGGSWAADVVWPAGASYAPFVSEGGNSSLVPNSSWMSAPQKPFVGPGDWIFHHPHEADAIFNFEKIRLVRGGRLLPEYWRGFPRRY